MLSPRATADILSGRRRGLAASLLRGMLAAAEPIYGWLVRRRNRRFDSGSLPSLRVAAPVISVGNLTVGGTGKTPLVCWLAEWFQTRGIPVTLISRGYGRSPGQPNDEALELAARLPNVPHLQSADRIAAAQQAISSEARQVLILDDAFQHRRIARDLDIVLLDALEPLGYERLLPRGLLREPVESLSRADVVGLSRADAVSAERRQEIRARVAAIAPAAPWVELAHRPAALIDRDGRRQPLGQWSGKQVLAFCGIGNPAGFAHSLRQAVLKVAAQREFPDHHRYQASDLAALDEWAKANPLAEAIVCTHKDLVKISRDEIGGLPLLALSVEIDILSGREELERRLQTVAAALTKLGAK